MMMRITPSPSRGRCQWVGESLAECFDELPPPSFTTIIIIIVIIIILTFVSLMIVIIVIKLMTRFKKDSLKPEAAPPWSPPENVKDLEIWAQHHQHQHHQHRHHHHHHSHHTHHYNHWRHHDFHHKKYNQSLGLDLGIFLALVSFIQPYVSGINHVPNIQKGYHMTRCFIIIFGQSPMSKNNKGVV